MAHARRRVAPGIRGFTLIEVLIITLIIGVLMAVAVPLYLSATANSQRTACRANMQTIANAEYAYKLANASHTYVAVTIAQSMTAQGLTTLQADPQCPMGGKYSVILTGNANDGRAVPASSLAVQCNYGTNAHGAFIPGDAN